MKRSAFTLIEVLLAVMLMALVLGVIYGVVWAGVKSRQSLSEETDALSRVNSAIDVIQGDIQRISCRSGALRILPLPGGGIVLEISAMPPTASDAAQKIYIFLMPQSGSVTPKLVRHIETDANFTDAIKAAESGETILTTAGAVSDDENFEILLDDVVNFNLRCNNGAWADNSYSAPAIPGVVEITLVGKTDRGKVVSVTRCVTVPVQAGPISSEAGQ